MTPPTKERGPGRFSAIVFDLDGTLVDSAAELAFALNTALGPLGRRTLAVAEVRAMIGDGVIVLTRRALAATGGVPDEAGFAAALSAVRAAYDRLPASAPYEGVGETLVILKILTGQDFQSGVDLSGILPTLHQFTLQFAPGMLSPYQQTEGLPVRRDIRGLFSHSQASASSTGLRGTTTGFSFSLILASSSAAIFGLSFRYWRAFSLP